MAQIEAIEIESRALDLSKDFLDDKKPNYSESFKWDKPFQVKFSSDEEVEKHQKRLGIRLLSEQIKTSDPSLAPESAPIELSANEPHLLEKSA